jgi:hypothetical protein
MFLSWFQGRLSVEVPSRGISVITPQLCMLSWPGVIAKDLLRPPVASTRSWFAEITEHTPYPVTSSHLISLVGVLSPPPKATSLGGCKVCTRFILDDLTDERLDYGFVRPPGVAAFGYRCSYRGRHIRRSTQRCTFETHVK